MRFGSVSVWLLLACLPTILIAQESITQYAYSNRTPTYFEVIDFYRQVSSSPYARLDSAGTTDAGYPLHTLILDRQQQFEPDVIRRASRSLLLINNAIHPGEPDGVDACIRLVHQWVNAPELLPENTVIVIIPMYNIGGALNRNSHSRANQNGPESYGFRGNARNYDLNRDFIKQDTENARTFVRIFHYWKPDIFIDTHVSNGADYQHVMTLVPTQHDKLSPPLGDYLVETVLPSLYRGMEAAGFPMSPYVDPIGATPDAGIVGFLDHPRYSTGYAALFNTIGFMTETHMLKPYPQRVAATEAFIEQTLAMMARETTTLKHLRAEAEKYNRQAPALPLNWKPDLACRDSVYFRGYTARYKPSEVSGAERLYYDRSAPWEKNIPLYDHYDPDDHVQVPPVYILPSAWKSVAIMLERNGIVYTTADKSDTLTAEVYYIDDYQTSERAYEGHYIHYATLTLTEQEMVVVQPGDIIIRTNQPGRRFIAEVLEPTAPDSYFSWNYFDPILMQKEWFSSYVFEDVAAELLREDAVLRTAFETKKQQEPAFANNAFEQLYFIYRHSPYYEPTHMRYPVLRVWEAVAE